MTAFLWFCLAGVGAALTFDVLRLIRAMIRHSTVVVMAEDLLWCVGCFASAFICVVRYADGVVRWFYLAGFFASLMLWFSLVSPWLLRLLKDVIRVIAAVLRCVWHILVYPVKKSAEALRKTTLLEKLFSKNLEKCYGTIDR